VLGRLAVDTGELVCRSWAWLCKPTRSPEAGPAAIGLLLDPKGLGLG